MSNTSSRLMTAPPLRMARKPLQVPKRINRCETIRRACGGYTMSQRRVVADDRFAKAMSRSHIFYFCCKGYEVCAGLARKSVKVSFETIRHNPTFVSCSVGIGSAAHVGCEGVRGIRA